MANGTAEQTVACPNCGTAVRLTDALAAPLLAAARDEYQRKLTMQAASFESERGAMQRAQQTIASDRESLSLREKALKAEAEQQKAAFEEKVAQQTAKLVAEQLATEKKAIIIAETRRAEARFADQMADRDRDDREKSERIAQLTVLLHPRAQAQGGLARHR